MGDLPNRVFSEKKSTAQPTPKSAVSEKADARNAKKAQDQAIKSAKESLKDEVPLDKEGVNVASQLVEPTGYKILVALPEVTEKTEGGIYKGEAEVQREQVGTVTGFVLKLGKDAYHNKAKFPNGPWCKKGEWVVFRAYSGTRISIHGKEFRLINDDSVEGTVEDPRGIAKVGMR